MRIHAIPPSLIFLFGGVVAALLLTEQVGWAGWLVVLPAAMLVLWAVLIAPQRRWRAWGWALADNELHVAWGLWTQVHTIVPLARVQHIDVAQGPVERANGVARLIVHTAGTAHATVVLPGVTRETAEQLRDTIRTHIRNSPW